MLDHPEIRSSATLGPGDGALAWYWLPFVFAGTALVAFGLLMLPFLALRVATGGDYGDNQESGLPLASLSGIFWPLVVLSIVGAAMVTWGIWGFSPSPIRRASKAPPSAADPYIELVDPWRSMPPELQP